MHPARACPATSAGNLRNRPGIAEPTPLRTVHQRRLRTSEPAIGTGTGVADGGRRCILQSRAGSGSLGHGGILHGRPRTSGPSAVWSLRESGATLAMDPPLPPWGHRHRRSRMGTEPVLHPATGIGDPPFIRGRAALPIPAGRKRRSRSSHSHRPGGPTTVESPGAVRAGTTRRPWPRGQQAQRQPEQVAGSDSGMTGPDRFSGGAVSAFRRGRCGVAGSECRSQGGHAEDQQRQ